MTPQERQLVAELFDRLASLERGARDPDAERAIAEGFARAPNAAYALVQTVLVQDEALKRANARIEALEAELAGETPRAGGFLDTMRDALAGREGRRGSVPSVRPGGLGTSGVWGAGPAAGAPPMGDQPAGQSTMGPSPMGSGMGSGMGPGTAGFGGGSFLGNAAASAAGVIGGAMLLNGIRSMFGHSPAARVGRAPSMRARPAGARPGAVARRTAISPARPASTISAATGPARRTAATAMPVCWAATIRARTMTAATSTTTPTWPAISTAGIRTWRDLA